MMKRYFAILALAALGTLAACGGAGPSANIPQPVKGAGAAAAPLPTGGPILIGVGDSLTAGEQSDALLGTAATSPISGYPGGFVPPGQDSGWFAVMYDCLISTGGVCNHNPAYALSGPQPALNPSLAILPLITAPGIGTQLVITTSGSLGPTQTACSAFNEAAFSESAWGTTRVSPSTGIADLGVPGITMHEAIAMTGPYEGPPTQSGTNCGYTTLPNDPTSGGLQSLVAAENQYWLPVLGEYQPAYGSSTTLLTVATGMAPKVTTVWLGANDLLKYIFSAGTAPASDTPTQMAADLTKIVKSLTATGSKVLVGDLPTLLPTTGTSVPQFFPQSKLSADLQALGIPSAAAGAIVSYVGTKYGVTAGGYLTESGFLSIVEGCSVAPATCTTPQLDPGAAGSGLGSEYLTPTFAGQVQALNAAYNQAIDSVATSSGSSVALVNINQLFQQASQGGVTAAGFPSPFTLQFGGGLVSWDGLHPSNLGYAVIANDFISTADASFGMTIPQLSQLQLANIAANDPYDPFVLKAANPNSPFPLP